MKFAVETKELSKKFGNQFAVNNLNLKIQKGQIFGLVGPDGAGKTTTLRMLATAISPDSGNAFVSGFNVSSQQEQVKLCIGYMPQSLSLYSDLTVDENIDFHADLYGVLPYDKLKKKEELLKFSDLTLFRKRLSDKLSGGMKKKLALCCTLIHTPDILILDEPTTGVDPVSRREFWEILYSLLPNVTIILSTPYMDEAERCNEVGLIYDGQIKISDSPKNIMDTFDYNVLEIKCDKLREARDVVSGLEGIHGVDIFGDSLHVFINKTEQHKIMLENLLKEKGFIINSFKQILPSLEDVFITLLK